MTAGEDEATEVARVVRETLNEARNVPTYFAACLDEAMVQVALAEVALEKEETIEYWASIGNAYHAFEQLVGLVDQFHSLAGGFISLRNSMDGPAPSLDEQLPFVDPLETFEHLLRVRNEALSLPVWDAAAASEYDLEVLLFKMNGLAHRYETASAALGGRVVYKPGYFDPLEALKRMDERT